MKKLSIIILILTLLLLSSLYILYKEKMTTQTKENYYKFNFSKAYFTKVETNIVSWDNLEQYKNEYIRTCNKSKSKLCIPYNGENFKEFILQNFDLYKIMHRGNNIATGYYIPTIDASLVKNSMFKYPIYGVPKDLVTIDLGNAYSSLKGKKYIGRVMGNKVVPYYTRAYIDKNGVDAVVIAYAKDKIDILNAQIQGSSMLNLVNENRKMSISYAKKNGYPYGSIGKYMVSKGYITLNDASMENISRYIKENPSKREEILSQNRSYVFFNANRNIVGALGLSLIGELSVAVDRKYIPLGSMIFIKTKDPITKGAYNKIVFAQDTGGAIKGSSRIDLFFGYGKIAKIKAQGMKYNIDSYIFIPKNMNVIE